MAVRRNRLFPAGIFARQSKLPHARQHPLGSSTINSFATRRNLLRRAALGAARLAATGAVGANFDFVMGLTLVAGPTNSARFKISVPAYANYTYEVYGNPTMANAGNGITNWSAACLTNMSWGGLPFSLTQAGAVNTNRFTAPGNGTLDIYLQEKSAKGFYYVSFRVPGANVGVP